jgi:hypothetical protein
MKPLTLLLYSKTEQHPDLYDNSHPEGQSGSCVEKNFARLEGAGYFQVNNCNKIAIQSVLMKATKIIHYDLGCLQVIM